MQCSLQVNSMEHGKFDNLPARCVVDRFLVRAAVDLECISILHI